MFEDIPQLNIICVFRTTSTHWVPALVGNLMIGESSRTVSDVFVTLPVLIKTLGIEPSEPTEFRRAFWLGENDWVFEDESIGKERAGFFIVAVDEAIIPHISISEVTANIVADSAFKDVLRNARTSLS